MLFMKGEMLKRTRKLVKGLAKVEPAWLNAMEKAPPATFPRAESKINRLSYPTDAYIIEFYQKHPDSLYHDPKNIFAARVTEYKEDEAKAVADMEYRNEKKARKKAYKSLKEICRLQGKKPPPKPYPSAIKEIQAEEKKYIRDSFFDPNIRKIVQQMKEDKAISMQYGFRGDDS